MPRLNGTMLIGIALTTVIGLMAPPAHAADEAAETARAERIIGPEGSDNACVNCHAREVEAWKQTRHFSTFVDRHRSERASEIQANLGRTGASASMKRSEDCRQCHYTSQVAGGRLRPKWGVSCESCHGPGRDWNNIHNKVGGDPAGKTMRWGEGRKEDAAARKARLDAAVEKGMIHSEMLYRIATNCFGCHTVPNESLVNDGKHKAGSDFDLVVWSQGEVRHNYLSSAGAPENPTNRPATREEKRYRYVIGALVDLEFTLRNLANVEQKGGAFHKAMVERANRARAKVEAILKAVAIPSLAGAVNGVPSPVSEGTEIGTALAEGVGKAARAFAADPPDLSAIDSLVPTEAKGDASP